MPTVTLRGASDDLIELDGAIVEEFNHYNDERHEGALVAFSDGTVLRITFTQSGIWRISLVTSGAASLSVVPAPEDDDGNYTDIATLTGDIRWAVHGIAFAKASAKA